MKKTSDYGGFDSQKYEVSTKKEGRTVCVCIMQGSFQWTTIGFRSTSYWISPPNIIERFLNISYADKIKNVERKLQKKCNKLNANKQLVDNL